MTKPNKIKPLVPPMQNGLGLILWCGDCRAQVSSTCKHTNKSLSTCPHPEKLQYKSVVRVKGEKNKKRTKNLAAKTITKALIEASIFKESVKETTLSEHQIEQIPQQKQRSEYPTLLDEVIANYSDYLDKQNLTSNPKNHKSKQHLKDIDRSLAFLQQALLNRGYNRSTFLITDINDQVVNDVYSALKAKNFSGRTINKYMSVYFTLMKDCSKRHFDVINYFATFKKESITAKPEIITQHEFESLIALINRENDVRTYTMNLKDEGKKNIRRRVYRPWLADAFRLCLETGRRREEVVKLKWNNIDEEYGVIITEDYKANRIKKYSGSEKRYVYIPLTPTLKSLLMTLGYGSNAGTDKYIIAPDIGISRERVMSDILTRAFSHYHAQLNTGKALTLKSLRKTYITALYKQIGPKARLITGHSSDAIMEGSYVHKRTIAGSTSFEGVYSHDEREKELKEVRSKNLNQQSKYPEIE